MGVLGVLTRVCSDWVTTVVVNMTEKKTNETQLKASRKWAENHREQRRYISYKATAKRSIKIASDEDLATLAQLIKDRQDENR
ncbi:hypothetical protein UCCLB521_1723 [Levilactobacillus brevis]|jgi:hypothetical protein|nr:hypothetical protein S101106_02039 [Levilactobacillus brevis]QCZ51528.1 hypothetical protein SAC12_1963 [Levilactobacillus brevis]QCZ56285.1 hypothetical protein UCCLB521_1723 [Levilactobacillus brevis]